MSARSTGIPSFDKVLSGGLFPGDVVEVYGKNASGKTQMCTFLAATTSRYGKGDSTVIYFDLKNDFSPMRLLELSGNDESGLDNVRVFRVPTIDRLFAALDGIKRDFVSGRDEFYRRTKLLIIDAVPIAIYPSIQNKKSWKFLTEELLQRLEWLANTMQLTVILVNQAVKVWDPQGTPSSTQTVKAALGEYWKNKIKIRVRLSKLEGMPSSSNYYSGYVEKCKRGYSGEMFYFSIATNAIKGDLEM